MPKYFDKDEGLKLQAGLDNLDKYAVVAEMENLLPLAKHDADKVWLLDDELATYYLLYKKEYSNFERKFSELKMKEIKRK